MLGAWYVLGKHTTNSAMISSAQTQTYLECSWDQVSLSSPFTMNSGVHCVPQASLKLTEIHTASVSHVLWLQAHTTNSFNSFKIYLRVCACAPACMHKCHGAYVEVRRQPLGVLSFLHVGPWDWMPVMRLGEGRFCLIGPSCLPKCHHWNMGWIWIKRVTEVAVIIIGEVTLL